MYEVVIYFYGDNTQTISFVTEEAPYHHDPRTSDEWFVFGDDNTYTIVERAGLLGLKVEKIVKEDAKDWATPVITGYGNTIVSPPNIYIGKDARPAYKSESPRDVREAPSFQSDRDDDAETTRQIVERARKHAAETHAELGALPTAQTSSYKP